MALIPSTISVTYIGALIPQSIITEWYYYITYIRYITEAHIYCSAQPSVFSHILLNDEVNNFLSFKSSRKCFLCEVVVASSCLLSSDKK